MRLFKVKARAEDGKMFKPTYVEAESVADALRTFGAYFATPAERIESVRVVSDDVVRS